MLNGVYVSFSKLKWPAVFIAGLSCGYALMTLVPSDMSSEKPSQEKPLYWVAPMDSNYRRDQPGLSPMGMDLVPVYKESHSDGDGPGTIKVSATVEHNLGVRTESAQVRPLTKEIQTVGIVQYDEDKIVHIHPRVEGWIETLHVKATGDPIKKGQPLYDLYSPELVNAQQEFIAEVQRGEQGFLAAAEQRLQALQISNTFIKQLKRTHTIKQTVTFYAPQAGVIDNLNIREGFYVQPGTTMMSIAALDQVWVEAEIFERQSHLVKVGSNVEMTLDFLPNRIWKGQVDYIYPSLDKVNHTLRVRLKFENPDEVLKPNMFSQIKIQAGENRSGLTIPKQALIRLGTQNRAVLALGHGRFKTVEVLTGEMTDQYVEIIKGLSEGEKVVTRAQFLLDSESSKESDFQRMSHPLTDTHKSNTIPTAQVSGVINTVHLDRQTVNISRGAIEKWNRKPATMDFIVSKKLLEQGFDLANYQKGERVNFTFEIYEDEFYITEIKKSHNTNHEGAQP